MKLFCENVKLSEMQFMRGIAGYFQGEINWFTPTEIPKDNIVTLDESRRKISEDAKRFTTISGMNSVLLTSRATIGTVAVLSTASGYNQGIKGIEPGEELDTWYLAHWLTARKDDIISKASGTTFKEISTNKVKELEIPLPPLSEQKKIVSKLEDVLEKIEKAKGNAEKNLQNSRELFESYLQSIFTNIGKKWEEVALSELATDITDGDHMPPPKAAKGIPFITISNIDKESHKIDFSNTFKVSKEYFQKLKTNRKPMKGDILYTVTGSFGIPVIVDSDLEFCFQRHIGLIRPSTQLNSKWLYYWILSPQSMKQANDSATGTAQKTVSLTALRNFMLPKLTLIEQKEIVKKLDELSEQTKQLESIYKQKIADLEELKKSVLDKAFKGEL